MAPFEQKIMNSIKTNWTEIREGLCEKGPSKITISHYSAGPLKKALIWGGGIVAAGLVGYGVYKLVSKLQSVKEGKKESGRLSAELEQEDMQIKKLDEQYKHVNSNEEIVQDINTQKSGDYTMEDVRKTIGTANIFFMLMDDDKKRKEYEEKMNEEYHKKNYEKSKYNNEHNTSTNWADAIVHDTSMGG